MKITGNWKGKGIEINHVVNNVNSYTVKLNLTMIIRKISDDVYRIISTYTYANNITIYNVSYNAGDVNWIDDMLIYKNGNKFITEPDDGNGIDYWKLKNNKLYYIYNINGSDNTYNHSYSNNHLSLVGKFKLKKC